MRLSSLLLLCALHSFYLTQAQTRSQAFGQFSQVYRLTEDEAATLLCAKKAPLFQESWLHTLADTFHGAEPRRPLAPGHYLLAEAEGEQVELELRSVHSIRVWLLPHLRDFLLSVTDSAGVPVRDARVLLRGKPAPFDTILQCYRLPRRSRGGFVEVYAAGESWFGHVDHENNTAFWRRWLNYHTGYGAARMLAFPVRWTARTVHRVKYWIRDGYWPRRYRRDYDDFPGYIAFNQPKYRPGDTLRVKAYVTNRRGKPWRRRLELEIREQYSSRKTILRRDIAPLTPGAFVFEMPLGDTLRLDRNYSVSFSEKEPRGDREPRSISEFFTLEDYQLDEVNYKLEPTAKSFQRGEKVVLHLNALDANNLPAPDASFKLVLLNGGATDFHAPLVYVPDTLWRHEQDFSEETVITVPDSIWPDASLKVDVLAFCTVSSGELQEKKASFSVLRPPNPLNVRLKNGFILIDKTFAPAVPDTVWLVETDRAENEKRRPVVLPFRERLQTAMLEYRVESGSQKIDMPMPEPASAVTNEAFCTSDSVFFVLHNPHRIEVRYQVFEGATQLEEGTVSDSLWKWRRPGSASHGLFYQFIWQGQTRRYFAEAIRFDKLLNIELDQPATVQPGQQVQVKIRVHDVQNRPVSGVNLTAGAYNRQFGEEKPYTSPDIEYKKMRWPLVRHNFYLKQAVAPVIKTPVTRSWYDRLQLDSLLYYRLRYRGQGWYAESIPIQPQAPPAFAETPEGLPWGLPYERDSFYRQRPQFAPHIIRANQAQPVYLVYCNSRLVYYYGATNAPRYSFYGWYGYNQITIRTRDGEYTLDSVYLKHGEKLEFALDGDRFKQIKTLCKVRFVPKPDTLTRFEQEDIRRSILLWRSGNAGMGHYFWNGPENIQAVTSHSGFPVHILGPFYPNETLYYLQSGAFFTSFKFEPGFEYSITQGRERLYQSRWPNGAAALPKNLPARLPGELAWGPQHLIVKTKKVPPPPKYQWSGRDQSGRASLQIRFFRPDTLLAVVLMGDSLLGPFRPDGRRFEDLPTGKYRLLVFSVGGAVWRQEIALRRDTLLFLDGTKDEFHPARPDESFGSLFPVSTVTEPSKQNISPTQFTQWPGAATGFNGISGRLTDETGEPLIGVSVLVSQGGIAVGGVLTDIEGNYRIFLPPGRYDLSFRYTGFSPAEVHGVYVSGDGLVAVSQQLEAGTMLHEVVVMAYKVPLIQQDMTSAGKTITTEQIRKLPTRNLNALSGNLAGISEIEKINIKGSRSALLLDRDETDGGNFSAGEPALRSSFRDYAYWQPNLITDPNGEAWFRATFPGNITGWNSFVLAMDRRKRAGMSTQNIRSFKPLTAKLSLPRFAVAGDRFDAAGLTSNFSGDSAEVQTAFRLDGKLLREGRARIGEGLAEFVDVTTPEADSLYLSYEMKSQLSSDGEKRGIAILPVGTLETAGHFLVMERDSAITLSFDPALGPVTVQGSDNTLDLLTEDIHFLRHYPYGCNEQNASRLYALLAEQKLSALPRKRAAQNPKEAAKARAVLEKEITNCIRRLQDAQQADGSWGWWAGGTPNAWMTIYVLRALREAGAAASACDKGLIWLRREVGGLPLAEQREALLLLREADVQFNCTPFLTRLDTLRRHSLYERLSHWRLQQLCGQKLPIDSLKKFLQPTTTGGLYCGEENAHWYNHRANNTLLAYDIARDAGWANITRDIRRYWLESRAAARQRNTIETAQVLRRLLPELLADPDTLRFNRLEINGTLLERFPLKQVFPAGEPTVSLHKSGNAPLYLSAYQQWQNTAPEPHNDLFEIKSWLEQGGRRVDSLGRGQAAEMVVTVQARKFADYVMLEVPIPAGCSYGEKRPATRPEVYREYFRDRTAIFFETLPAGRYEFRIALEPRYTGRFTLNPVKAEQMYFPVFFGRNTVNVVHVY